MGLLHRPRGAFRDGQSRGLWDEWNQRRRIEDEHWRAEQERFNRPIHPESEWDDWPPKVPERPTMVFPVEEPGDAGSDDRRDRPPPDLAGCLSSIAFVPALAAWPLLYPVPVVLGLLCGGFVYGAIEAAFDVYRAPAVTPLGVLGGAVGLVAAIASGRADHRLARSRAWRWPRHALRLVVVVVVAHLVAVDALGAAQDAAGPVPGLARLADPLWLGGLAAVAALAQFVLTRERLLAWWHARLEAVWLRPRAEG